jgi:hypothetical protein
VKTGSNLAESFEEGHDSKIIIIIIIINACLLSKRHRFKLLSFGADVFNDFP